MGASRLDELMWHQAPLPLGVAATSDYRFYDRVFVTVTDPAGSAALAMGMVAQAILQAATDPSDRMRYPATPDAQGALDLRDRLGSEGFVAAMRERFPT